MLISRTVLAALLGFHPIGRSETPLYKESFLDAEDVGRVMLTGVFERSEDALEGDFGPAIVNAIFMLIAFAISKRYMKAR